MTVPVPEYDVEFGNAVFRFRSGGGIKYVGAAGSTGLFSTPINTDGTATLPTGYTALGGIGVGGVCAAIKSTSGTTADADFTGATPAISAPPIGTLVYNTNTHKLQIRDAAGSWLISAAFS